MNYTFADSGLSSPTGIATDSAGFVFVANHFEGTIRKFSPTGVDLGYFATSGLDLPYGMTFGPTGDLFVANFGNGTIRRFSPDGTDLGNFTDVPCPRTRDITFDAAGNAYALCFLVPEYQMWIRKLDPNGNDLGIIATTDPFITADGLNYHSDGYLYMMRADGIARYTTEGGFLGIVNAGNGSAIDIFFAPNGQIITSTGSNIVRYNSSFQANGFGLSGSGATFLAPASESSTIPEPSTYFLVGATLLVLIRRSRTKC